MTQQTEQQLPTAPDDLWIAQVPDMTGKDIFIVFGGRDYDATYPTREQAEGRIAYLKRGGDGW